MVIQGRKGMRVRGRRSCISTFWKSSSDGSFASRDFCWWNKAGRQHGFWRAPWRAACRALFTLASLTTQGLRLFFHCREVLPVPTHDNQCLRTWPVCTKTLNPNNWVILCPWTMNKTLLAAAKMWGITQCERILVAKSVKCTRVLLVNRKTTKYNLVGGGGAWDTVRGRWENHICKWQKSRNVIEKWWWGRWLVACFGSPLALFDCSSPRLWSPFSSTAFSGILQKHGMA